MANRIQHGCLSRPVETSSCWASHQQDWLPPQRGLAQMNLISGTHLPSSKVCPWTWTCFFALFGAGTGSFGTLPVRRILTTRLTLNLFGLGFLAAIGLKIELPRKQPATAGGPKRVSKLCEVLYTEELDLDFECSNSGHATSCNHTRDGIVSACSGTPKGSRSCTLE